MPENTSLQFQPINCTQARASSTTTIPKQRTNNGQSSGDIHNVPQVTRFTLGPILSLVGRFEFRLQFGAEKSVWCNTEVCAEKICMRFYLIRQKKSISIKPALQFPSKLTSTLKKLELYLNITASSNTIYFRSIGFRINTSSKCELSCSERSCMSRFTYTCN